jgi:ATP-dependent helicase HrpB
MTLNATLPIHALLPEIEQTVAQSPNCILKAEPGAGKSTQVPLYLLNADWLHGKKIIMLEPRRLAVRSLAHYLAKQLGEPIGQSVGYQVRNEKKSSTDTKLEIVTEGILIRRLQQDPELNGTGLVIFDEFHERSLEADLALALCLDSQSALREDLKLLVMSATLEDKNLSSFLDNAPIIDCPGRSYPVEQHYLDNSIQNQGWMAFNQTLVQTIQKAINSNAGDCLVFLPGKGEILQAIKQSENLFSEKKFALIPLYGSLSTQQQNLALEADKHGRRKIIFSTNIAETSLTIDGIGIVVDSGQVRRASYDASSGMTRMLTQKVSQASAKQRAGRAGRLSAGHAYRLWTAAEHKARAEYEKESILTSDLTDLCLEIAMWGVHDPADLRWLTLPPKSHVQIAQGLLITLGFLNSNGSISKQGQQAMQLGLSARLAKVLLHSQQLPSMQSQLCDIAALLSERDILKNSYSANLEDRIQALQAYKNNPTNNHQNIISSVAKEALTNSKNWQKRLQNLALFPPEAINTNSALSIAQCVALAYPDRIAKRRSNQDNRYLLSNGKGTFLAENDALNQSEYFVVTNLDGQRKNGKVFIAMPISQDEIEELFADKIEQQTEVKFNRQKQKVEAVQVRKFGALILSQKTTNQIKNTQLQECIIEHLKNNNLNDLPWNQKSLDWLKRVNWLAQYHEDYAGFSEQALMQEIDDWLAPYLTNVTQWADLNKIDLLALLQAKLSYQQLQDLEQQAPTHYQAPSNKRVAIDYQIGKQPTISIQLQELFSEVRSPSIAFGKVMLSFELLSPARRPIQITSDLGQFWQNSYFEIAKEMRGKYPKHRWPEKPLEEKAGRSLQANRQRKT